MDSLSQAAVPHAQAGTGQPMLKRLVLSRVAGLTSGQLTIVDARGEWHVGTPAPDGLRVRLTVHRDRLWRRVTFGGLLAASDAYLDGDWDADDLTGLARLFSRNIDQAHRARLGSRPVHPADARRSVHRLARNTGAAPEEHRRALRPRQRLLRIVARSDHDLLVSRVRGAGDDAGGREPGEDRPPVPQARPARRRPPAGDRHRMGRSRDSRRRTLRLPCHHGNPFGPPARPGGAAGRGGRSADRVRPCCSPTTATWWAPTRSWCRSR